MTGWNRIWHAIRRFITRTGTTAAATPASGQSDGVDLQHDALGRLHAGSSQLSRLRERLREKLRETQVHGDRSRREEMRMECRAMRRALVLLLRQMNPEQRREFRELRHFHVTGGSGDRYRIRVGTISNIEVLRRDGTVKHRLCIRPAEDVPVYDVMAAQLLHLYDPETEKRLLQHANTQLTLTEERAYYRTTWTT